MIKKLFPVFLTVLLFQSVYAEKNDFFNTHNTIIKNILNGNDTAEFNKKESFLLNNPDNLYSAFFFRDMLSAARPFGYKRIEKLFQRLLERYASINTINSNRLSFLLKLELEKLYYLYDPDKAEKITGYLNPLSSWKLYGAYNLYGYGDFDYPFHPEGFSGSNADSSVKLNISNRDRVLHIDRIIFPDYGIVYAASAFELGSIQKFRIRIYSSSEYKLFINSKLTISNHGKNYSSSRMIDVDGIKQISMMIKTLKMDSSKWNFRILLTDINDRPLNYKQLDAYDTFKQNFTFSEKLEEPYRSIKQDTIIDSEKKSVLDYYDALMYGYTGSSSAGDSYLKAIKNNDSEYINIFYALWLLDFYSDNKNSFNYLKGYSIINEYNKTQKLNIPSLNRGSGFYLNNNDLPGALISSKKILSAAPGNFEANINYIIILKKAGYNPETESAIHDFRKKFPESSVPDELHAQYIKLKNPAGFISIYEKLLAQNYSKQACSSLIKAYMESGNYKKAAELGLKYNHNKEYTYDIIEAYIENNDFESAEKLLNREKRTAEIPSLLYLQAVLDSKKNGRSSAIWKKIYNINNSGFSFLDYSNYLESGTLTNPFKVYDDDPVQNPYSLVTDEIKKQSSAVLISKRYFMILDHGASRLYCEDLIYTGDKNGANRRGDYKIPYRGKMHPVLFRVYNQNGAYYDTHTIQNINGEYHINFNGLDSGSIIHLSYLIDNPLRQAKGSSFFYSAFLHQQNYDEICGRYILKVISSADKKINFTYKGSPVIENKTLNNINVKTFKYTNLPAVTHERFNGTTLNALTYVAFSGMQTREQFSIWYNGLIADFRITEAVNTDMFKNDTDEKTIQAVYNFVSNEIENSGSILYYPDDPVNVYLSKRGTVEDKVILTKLILEKTGIKSKIAFGRSRVYPDTPDFISPVLYASILLFIELNNKEYWFDYSDPFFPCGITDSELEGTTALVLESKGVQLKKISSTGTTLKSSRYYAVIDKNGNADFKFYTDYSGRYSEEKKFFKHKSAHEDLLISYYNGLVSTYIQNDYSVENFKGNTGNLVIKSEGSTPSFAVITGEKIIFQPVINKSPVYRYIISSERKQLLVIYSDIIENEYYNYTIPDNYRDKSIEQINEFKFSKGNFSLSVKKKKGSNEINIVKRTHIKSSVIKPEDYSEFFNFCMKMKQSETGNIVIEGRKSDSPQ